MPTPLKTIIIEDNPQQQENLMTFLRGYKQELELFGTANSVSTGYQLIKKTQPDLVFMDIQLYEGTAFHILEQLKKENIPPFKIIFTTAFEETDYMTKAIEYSAVSYLIKPINRQLLDEAIHRTITEITNEKQSILEVQAQFVKQIQLLIEAVESREKPQKLLIKLAEKSKILTIIDILYLQAEGGMTRFFIKDGTKHTGNQNMGKYHTQLEQDHQFIRINHSQSINPRYIKGFSRINKTIRLNNQDVLTVSDRKSKNVFRFVEQYLQPEKDKSSGLKELIKRIKKRWFD